MTPSDPVDRYARLWDDGGSPDLDAFLAAAGPLTPADLAAVLRVDQRQRWRAGDRRPAEEYVGRLPPPPDPELALDLIYNEYLIREEAGDRPDPAEFDGRFPAYAAAVREQVALHDAFGTASLGRVTIEAPSWVRETADGPAPAEGPAGADAHPLPSAPGYEVEGVLGRGGMGVVYRARHVALNRPVALKVLPLARFASAAARLRFRGEAEAVARLSHPNVVQVYDVGEHRGLPFIALELCAGGSLADRLDGTPWPPTRAAELVGMIARGVEAAHAAGVVHRDLKPANVLLALDGAAKVTDFGLAKRLDGDDGLTQTGAVMGTPSYMAPEQAAGSPAVGVGADVYALGAILYELLTGRPPFKAATPMETLDEVRTRDPVPPRRLRPRLPRDLETVCLKCLEKDAARRYPSAAALGDDLARAADGRPVVARSAGRAERAARWVRRNPGRAALGGTIAGLLVVMAAGAVAGVVRLDSERDRAVRAEKAVRDRLWESNVARAAAARTSRRVGQRFDSLAALTEALRVRPDPRLRDEAAAALALPDLRVTAEWDGWPEGSLAADFDDAARVYARAAADGSVTVRRVEDDAEVCPVLPPPGRGAAYPVLSPDGRAVAVGSADAGLILWRLTGPPEVVARVSDCRAWAFTADGARLAVASGNGTVHTIDLATKRVRGPLPGDPLEFPRSLAIDPAGRRYATWAGGLVRFRDLDTGAQVAEFAVDQSVEDIAWHPLGRVVAVARADGVIELRDVATGRAFRTLDRVRSGGIRCRFAGGGSLLVASAWDGAFRLLDAQTGAQLLAAPTAVRWVGRGPGDLLFADTVGRRLRLCRAADGREFRALVCRNDRGVAAFPRAIARSADGRLLAVGREDGWGLLDPAGEVLAFSRTGQTNAVVFDSSGAILTHGPGGAYRWPVREDAADPAVVRVGPPQRLPLEGTHTVAAFTPDGQVAAVADRVWAHVAYPGRPGQVARIGPLNDVRAVALSPDGRWLATGGHGSQELKVWELPAGRLVHEQMVGTPAVPTFSPNGQWLACTGDPFRVWEAGSWRQAATVEVAAWTKYLAFSPDSRVLAVESGSGVVRLIDPGTGREVGRLSDPAQEPVIPTFGPDGGTLLGRSADTYTLRVWDLRAVRAGLKEFGMDWDLPDLPSPAPAAAPVARAEIVLSSDLARLRAEARGHVRSGRWPQAVEALRTLRAVEPPDPWVAAALAEALARGPRSLGGPAAAVEAGRAAVALRPGNGFGHLGLGLALFRHGDYAEAGDHLEEAVRLEPGYDTAFTWFHLTLCRLGAGRVFGAVAAAERWVGKWREEYEALLRRIPKLSKFPPVPKAGS